MTAEAEELQRHLDRIVEHIFEADRAWYVGREISRHSSALDAESFGGLMTGIQSALWMQFTLALTKIFERANSQYPTLSIPTLLARLNDCLDTIPILDKTLLCSVLHTPGPTLLRDLSDAEFKLEAMEYLLMLSPDTSFLTVPNTTLKANKMQRDKRIAHSEDVAPESFIAVTWEQNLDLLSLAKQVVVVIGETFTGTHYRGTRPGAVPKSIGDLHYMPSDDAERDSRALRRLLHKAGIALDADTTTS